MSVTEKGVEWLLMLWSELCWSVCKCCNCWLVLGDKLITRSTPFKSGNNPCSVSGSCSSGKLPEFVGFNVDMNNQTNDFLIVFRDFFSCCAFFCCLWKWKSNENCFSCLSRLRFTSLCHLLLLLLSIDCILMRVSIDMWSNKNSSQTVFRQSTKQPLKSLQFTSYLEELFFPRGPLTRYDTIFFCFP